MKLLEHEAKALFRLEGIAVPEGRVVTDDGELREAMQELGLPIVLKAQVLGGGRGKRGLVVGFDSQPPPGAVADLLEKAGDAAFGVLVERRLEVAEERYVAIRVDDVSGQPELIVGSAGGIEVEQMAASGASRLVSLPVDPVSGLAPYHAIPALKGAGWAGQTLVTGADLVCRLYRVFEKGDLDFVEVNPLISTPSRLLVAADAKATVDDSALYRHPEWAPSAEREYNDPLERRARSHGITFVNLDGDIVVLGMGAGLTMSLLDEIGAQGARPANFMDTSGGVGPQVLEEMAKLAVERAKQSPQARAIVISGLLVATPLKDVIDGLIAGFIATPSPVPVLACIRASAASVQAESLDSGVARLRQVGIASFPSPHEAVSVAVTRAPGTREGRRGRPR